MLLTLLAPQDEPVEQLNTVTHLRVAGTWKVCTVWLRVGGTWKITTLKLNVLGAWR